MYVFVSVVESHKIGVLIHKKDLNKVLKLFSDFKHSEIIELENGEAKEFFYEINKVKVEVCAEYDHGTYFVVNKSPVVIIAVGGMRLPCFSLESEREAWRKLGNDTKFIDEFLLEIISCGFQD